MRIGSREFDFENHTYVMGILNMTPDSFSDGGKWNNAQAAMAHVDDMIRHGATIIDVGGESTRPGFLQVSKEEEIRRTAPIIARIKEKHPDIAISIDTSKAEVAREAIQAGADIVNEVSGLFGDPKMAELIADTGVHACLMHNGQYIVKSANCANHDMNQLKRDMQSILDKADKAGIARDKIILDPGVGFGKTQEENAMIIANLAELKSLGTPLLLGISRKSVIGYLLNVPVEQRLEGTMVGTVLAVQAGYGIVRVHDVEENYRAIQMMEAVSKWMK